MLFKSLDTYYSLNFIKCSTFKKYKSDVSLLAVTSRHLISLSKGTQWYQLLWVSIEIFNSYACKDMYLHSFPPLTSSIEHCIHSVTYPAVYAHTVWIVPYSRLSLFLLCCRIFYYWNAFLRTFRLFPVFCYDKALRCVIPQK